MRNHRDYPKQILGSSDISSLVLRFCDADKLRELRFGGDGEYSAYIVDAECAIPDHYHLVDEGSDWLWMYDDSGRTTTFKGETIRVYRAGAFGCIIQVI